MNKKIALLAGGSLAAIAAGAAIYFKTRRTIPKNAVAVKPFDIDKYLGKWYEIARIDFIHERNLSNTTAEYALLENGMISVLNSGYNEKTGKWESAQGKAKFAGAKDEGKLQVTFFGPFYSGYNVIDIDDDYKHVLVAGETLDYLWLLSREQVMPDEYIKRFLNKAQSVGYDTSRLNWIEHNR